MKPAGIEVNIEELVLHGFSPVDRYRIGEAMQQELARLLAEGGIPLGLAKGGDVDRLDGGEFMIRLDSKAKSIGEQMAGKIYRGFGK